MEEFEAKRDELMEKLIDEKKTNENDEEKSILQKVITSITEYTELSDVAANGMKKLIQDKKEIMKELQITKQQLHSDLIRYLEEEQILLQKAKAKCTQIRVKSGNILRGLKPAGLNCCIDH